MNCSQSAGLMQAVKTCNIQPATSKAYGETAIGDTANAEFAQNTLTRIIVLEQQNDDLNIFNIKSSFNIFIHTQFLELINFI